MAILALNKIEEQEKFPIQKVYDAFQILNDKYKNLLGELYFTKINGFFYSKGLEDIFFAMGTNSLLERDSPDYFYYIISSNSKKRIKNGIEKILLEEQFIFLKEIASEFRNIIFS